MLQLTLRLSEEHRYKLYGNLKKSVGCLTQCQEDSMQDMDNSYRFGMSFQPEPSLGFQIAVTAS